MRTRIFKITTFLMLAAFPAVSLTAAPFNQLSGKSYDVARKRLADFGYRPLKFMHQSNPCPDGQSFCSRYPEVISCSGTGRSFCEFAFFGTRNRKYIVVITVGEDRPSVYRVRIPNKNERNDWDHH